MISADHIHKQKIADRKYIIYQEAGINDEDDDLSVSKKVTYVINQFIEDYFSILQVIDGNCPAGSILLKDNLKTAFDREISLYKEKIKVSSRRAEDAANCPINIYEFSGAEKLAAANRITRKLSTTLGLLWERLANVSPYAINPEAEFGLKIKGVDLISKNINSNEIEYQQLKSQKNTLTGSQKSRSIQELSMHANPVFCACFDLGKWTFNSPCIPRVAGRNFWSRIGIEYSIFENAAKALMLELEIELIK